jgi:deoxyribodipyrimidine photolyase-related protein
MSNYCQNCHYSVKEKTGDKACPFNYLYWNFLAQHQDKLSSNQRLSMVYNVWNKMTVEKQQAIIDSAQKFLNTHELR